jgi:cell division protein FtsB
MKATTLFLIALLLLINLSAIIGSKKFQNKAKVNLSAEANKKVHNKLEKQLCPPSMPCCLLWGGC